MSNNLMSQQLPIQSIQMGQVEPISNKLDSSMQMGIIGRGNDGSFPQMSLGNTHMGMMGSVSTDALSLHLPASNSRTQPSQTLPNSDVSRKLSVRNMQLGRMDPLDHTLFCEQYPLDGINMGSQPLTMLTKRKEPMEPTSNGPGLQKLSMSNKRIAQTDHRPWLQHASSDKLPVQSQPVSTPPQRSQAPLRRSASHKSGMQNSSVQKNQNGQPSPKVQSESSESVRSKLRESLAAALALVSQEQNKSSGKNIKNEESSKERAVQETSQPARHGLVASDAGKSVSEESKESVPTTGDPLAQNCNDVTAPEDYTKHSFDCGIGSKNDEQLTINVRDEGSSFSDCFFAKDELLQGNGLSWVLEPGLGVADNDYAEIVKKQQDLGDSFHVSGAPAGPSPETIASDIEAELFKLYGGVNKKYKEKGRSLLFNLKDRNNPELKARVMSGEIPPERLCSMTAEELASKELSEWRMAKAEEFAQMVVLSDTDINMRRLVKKTHKGEFQVEVESEENISAEVAVRESSVTRMESRPKEKEGASPSQSNQLEDKGHAVKEKVNSDDQNVLMIPSSEGNDLMQGLMVDDELKDAEFLPPIVSLDEFMESLNSEPPFENLPVDGGKTSAPSDKVDSQVSSASKSSETAPRDQDEATSSKSEITNVTQTSSGADGKSTDKGLTSEAAVFCIPKGEQIWEGLLQTNISVITSVIGIFKSGEKTSAKDWPSLVEIKGRVRLDAFEKFLQELPMSRSRAVMAVHFVCNERSADGESASLSEVADLYVTDSRVGFGEPVPGVELYLCPPHSKTCDILGKVLTKDHVDTLNAIDHGLIGVIVWRKHQIPSTISPNSASHHKHNSKKQHFSSRKQEEKDASVNMNTTSKQPLRGGGTTGHLKPQPDEDDDDLPPGFGPQTTRDEDDLPEFNFSTGSLTPRTQFSTHGGTRGQGMAHFNPHSQAHPRPVDQMRELVHRYGQPKTSTSAGNWPNSRGGAVAQQPWDDDDDMPEWRPEDNKPQVSHPQPVYVHGSQQPTSHTNMAYENPHQQMARPQNVHLQPLLRPAMVQESPQQTGQPAMPSHPQVNVAHGFHNSATTWQQSPWMAHQNAAVPWQQGPWVAPNSGPRGVPLYQPNGGQLHATAGFETGQQGTTWRRDLPPSRGA